MKIVHWLAGFAAAVGVLQVGVVSAQSYPNRPIKLIVPFGAGSGSDILARILADGRAIGAGARADLRGRAGTDDRRRTR